tara:strand:+ start:271 stop:495 length:225 start_codon:yes stop_codon:yes gene_type:complete
MSTVDMDLKNVIEIRMIEDLLRDKPNLLKTFQEIVLVKNIELAQYCFSHYSESEEEVWSESESEDEEEFNYQNA